MELSTSMHQLHLTPPTLGQTFTLEESTIARLWKWYNARQGDEERMANANLSAAKKAKKDEFYTQYADIMREMEAYLAYDADVFRGKTVLLPCDDPASSNFTKYFAENFERIGLKKLISTSYALDAKNLPGFESPPDDAIRNSPCFDREKERSHGKIYVLDEDTNRSGRIDVADLKWDYLTGDGDFRSAEVKALRDEADIIVTNPPFSLFREFLAWIVEADKKFSVIGNMNAITYKEVFPLIMENRMWLGESIHSGDRQFGVPDCYELNAAGCGIDEYGRKFIRVKGVRWFTNLEHGRRHEPLNLMTLRDNVKYSKHKEIKGLGYRLYDNYPALEIPYTDAIPSDYFGDFAKRLLTNEHGYVTMLAEQSRAEQSRAEQSRAEQSRAEQSRAEQSRAEQLAGCRVAASWESQSVSSTSTAPNSLNLSVSRIMERTVRTTCSRQQLTDARSSSESSFDTECNGIMGVPISFLDKYCPEQFEIVGLDRYVESNPHYGHRFTIDGKETYARILIRHRNGGAWTEKGR